MLKRKIASALIVFLLIPAVIITGYCFLSSGQYYIAVTIIMILAIVPFFLMLEKRKIDARELVTLASVTAIAVAGRAAFYNLPQVKPTCGIVIIAAVIFGPYFGFLTGSLSMLLSNLLFGMGSFTSFQMFGMGLTALICGLIFHKKKAGKSMVVVAIIGAVLCFAVYGFVVDTSSVLIMSGSLTLNSAIAVYAAGVPFNAIHAATTFIVIILLGEIFAKKLERISLKYGIFCGEDR